MNDHLVRPQQAQRFQRLAWPHLDGLLRLALVLTRHQQDAEDLVQQTMLKALQAIDSFQEGTNVRTWLTTILRHTHVDRIRAAQRQPDTVSLDHDGFSGSAHLSDPAAPSGAAAGAHDGDWNGPQAMMDQFEDRQVIAALRALPLEMRWTLLLVDVEQLDHAQAAAILSVAVGTVKSRASRARAMLRDRLIEMDSVPASRR